MVQPGTRFIDGFTAVARLKPGVSMAQAEAEGTLVARRVQAVLGDFGHKDDEPAVIRLVPLHERVVGRVRSALLIVLGAVAFVLLISTANLAHVLLARGTARRREMAVRAAIGASRRRLIQQSLTESVMLSLAAGALGVLLARWMLGILPALSPATLPRLQEVGLDTRVLACALILSLLTAVVFGALPALQASRADTRGALADGASQQLGGLRAPPQPGAHAAHRRRARRHACPDGRRLATGRELRPPPARGARLRVIERGHRADPLPASRYPAARRAVFYEDLLARAAGLPSVETAGLAASLPLAPGRSNAGFRFEDGAPASCPARR